MHADGIPAEEQRNLTEEPFGQSLPKRFFFLRFYMEILLLDLERKGVERGIVRIIKQENRKERT